MIFLTQAISIHGQFVLSNSGVKFLQSEVSEIRIIISPDSLNLMFEQLSNEHEYPATFIFINSLANDTVENIGFRLRGNTSLFAEKKSFKVSFNSFLPGTKWRNIEKLNLVSQQNDPSLIRSKLCHDAFRAAGIAAARTAYVNLYINDEFRGVYLNVEHIDENFASDYFDAQGNGNLYKCSYPANLDYLGSDPAIYQEPTSWGAIAYELQTNREQADFSDLAHFIDVLNNTSLSQLPCELPKVFNVEKYLKIAALEVLLGHWDAYAFNMNNFYLYQNQQSGVFEFIPYDMDNTLGIDWIGLNWSTRNIYNWAPPNDARPLFKRLMQVPLYRDQYSEHIQTFVNEYFNQPEFIQSAQTLQSLIESFVANDEYYTLDSGFDMESFNNSIYSAWGEHVNFGIQEYINLRIESALEQLENFTPTTVADVYWVQPQFDLDGDEPNVHIKAMLSQNDQSQCKLWLSNNNINWFLAPEFTDSGIFPDEQIDSIYTYRTNSPTVNGKLYYKIICTNPETTYPCSTSFLWTNASSDLLFINEVMPSNSSTLADEVGEYDDWLEIYNGGTTAVNLSEYYISDEMADWNKFRLPAMTLNPGEFVIVWLDGDPEQGILHADFSLNSGENQVWLNKLDEGEPRAVDYFAYPSSPNGELSWERITDGSDIINFTDAPTPGTTNFITSLVDENQKHPLIYPNPANDRINFGETILMVKAYDSTGKKVTTEYMTSTLNVSTWPAGLYTVHLDDYVCRILIQH